MNNGWLAGLSDIIRFGLLSTRGGIWLDSTLYVSSEIKGFDQSVYSIRHKNGKPRWVLDGYRWSAFMFASNACHPVTAFIYDGLLEYYSKEDFLIDYFLVDYSIATGYLNLPFMKKAIDNFPLNNPESLKLLLLRDQPFDGDLLKEILEQNRFNKLDWRLDIKDGSLLSHIMKTYEQSGDKNFGSGEF